MAMPSFSRIDRDDLDGLIGEIDAQVVDRGGIDKCPTGNECLHGLDACPLFDPGIDECGNPGARIIRGVIIRNVGYGLGQKDVEHASQLALHPSARPTHELKKAFSRPCLPITIPPVGTIVVKDAPPAPCKAVFRSLPDSRLSLNIRTITSASDASPLHE